jgi:hypothetical protein
MGIGKIAIGLLGLGLATTVSLLNLPRDTKESQLQEYEIGSLSFRMNETYSNRIGGPMWTGTVLLPKEYLNRTHLDRLFRWYSKRHPISSERINLSVYTELSRIPNADTVVLSDTDNQSTPEASFYRQGDGAASGGGENEVYNYCPDPTNPNARKYVVLRGKDPFAKKEIAETWAASQGEMRVRIMAYELKGREPSGVYYTLQSAVKDPEYWDSVITWRQDERVRIPQGQLRFVSDRIAYFYMGHVLAITADGGREWATWDASRELEDQECCVSAKIENIQVGTDGKGSLNLRLVSGGRLLDFSTEDYGKRWTELD